MKQREMLCDKCNGAEQIYETVLYCAVHGSSMETPRQNHFIFYENVNILAWNIWSHLIWFLWKRIDTRALSSSFYDFTCPNHQNIGYKYGFCFYIVKNAHFRNTCTLPCAMSIVKIRNSLVSYLNSIHFLYNFNGLKSIIGMLCANGICVLLATQNIFEIARNTHLSTTVKRSKTEIGNQVSLKFRKENGMIL